MASMYFIALVAPGEINQEALKWKHFMKDRFGCNVALRSPAHITLIPPFWMKEDLEQDLRMAIEKFSILQNPFEIYIRDFGAFKPRVIYIDVVKNHFLEILHLKLLEFITTDSLFPVSPEDRTFHPHITVATRDLRRKNFYEAWEIFMNKKFEASWMAQSISLLRHNQKNWDVVFTSQFKVSDASQNG